MNDSSSPSSKRETLVLNPRKSISTQFHYDSILGYDMVQMNAVQSDVSYNQERILDPVLKYGYENATVCTPDVARALWETKGALFYDRPYDKSYLVSSQQQMMGALEKLLTGPFDAKLKNYFYSNYAIIFCTFMETLPDPNAAVKDTNISMGWHCDSSPSAFLKLLLYLNDADEHHGGTEVVDRYTTDLFKKVGYVFGPIEERTTDLHSLADHFQIPYTPDLLQPNAGQGLLFEPVNIMHRGYRPTTGVRRILQLGIIPWPQGWRHFIDNTGEFTWKNEATFPNFREQMQ